jgi:hypothetical protein
MLANPFLILTDAMIVMAQSARGFHSIKYACASKNKVGCSRLLT